MIDSSGFEAYALYNAIKLHFTSNSYHYVKYNGKTSVSKNTFSTKKDRFTFYKLSRKFNLEDLKYFYIANFLYDNGKWPRQLLTQDAEDNYKKWQKITQSLTYTFENDIIRLLDKVKNPNDILTVPSGGYPILLEMTMQGDISLETLVILNDIMNFFVMWNDKIEDDIIWPNFHMKCDRYLAFMNYDKKKFKTILTKLINETK